MHDCTAINQGFPADIFNNFIWVIKEIDMQGKLGMGYCFLNRIYNKMLARDWFCTRLFAA